jgi:hypothetical protein
MQASGPSGFLGITRQVPRGWKERHRISAAWYLATSIAVLLSRVWGDSEELWFSLISLESGSN